MMSIELTEQQQKVLEATRPLDTPDEFQALLGAAKTEMDRVVREAFGPEQAIRTTTIELRDLYLTVMTHAAKLDTVNYGPERRQLLCDAVRLLATADLWFVEGARTGAYRVRTVDLVVATSRPWRARLKAYADQAFAFEPEHASVFADVNSSGTLQEEIGDLRSLVANAQLLVARLAEVGMKPQFLSEGEDLLREAEGRDLLGILGIRNQAEGILLRNRILTFSVLIGKEARAAGVNACYDEPETRRRFETASFRDALRRLRPGRRGNSREDEPEGLTPAQEATPPGAASSAYSTAHPPEGSAPAREATPPGAGA
jgi:hypothetical protein